MSQLDDLLAHATEELPDAYEGDYRYRAKKVGNYETYVFMGPGIGAWQVSVLTPWQDGAKKVLGMLHRAYIAGVGDGVAENGD